MTVYVGSIVMWSGLRIPRHLLACKGQTLKVQQHKSLFSLIGNRYGGDGIATFNLPDLQGRTMIGSNYLDAKFSLGVSGGFEEVNLRLDQMPKHSHQLRGESLSGASPFPNNNICSAGVSSSYDIYVNDKKNYQPINSENISTVGSGLPHQNMQPTLVITLCIVWQGIMPPFGDL